MHAALDQPHLFLPRAGRARRLPRHGAARARAPRADPHLERGLLERRRGLYDRHDDRRDAGARGSCADPDPRHRHQRAHGRAGRAGDLPPPPSRTGARCGAPALVRAAGRRQLPRGARDRGRLHLPPDEPQDPALPLPQAVSGDLLPQRALLLRPGRSGRDAARSMPRPNRAAGSSRASPKACADTRPVGARSAAASIRRRPADEGWQYPDGREGPRGAHPRADRGRFRHGPAGAGAGAFDRPAARGGGHRLGRRSRARRWPR